MHDVLEFFVKANCFFSLVVMIFWACCFVVQKDAMFRDLVSVLELYFFNEL